MNVSWYIAKRYFFAKKSNNLINLISGISMIGIGIGAMALIVVLSAFNGIEGLVEKLYSSFDPDIRIEIKTGKTFSTDSIDIKSIQELPFVEYTSKTIEETALMKYRDAQCFVTLKGVEDDYLLYSGIDSLMFDGETMVEDENGNHAILGYGIADQLNIFLTHLFEPIQLYAAKRDAKGSNLQDAFVIDALYPSGIFAINPEFDYKYALVPYGFAENLFQYPRKMTSLDIGVLGEANLNDVKTRIESVVGEKFAVKTRYELNELLYKTNQTEKWITFYILSFILLIAAFNLLGSLTILIMDKKDDVFVLQTMGASPRLIQNLFMLEGFLISLVGGGLGVILGVILCLLQQHVGLLKLQEGTIAEYYPITMEFFDFIAVSFIVLIIGGLTAYLPARFVARKYILKS